MNRQELEKPFKDHQIKKRNGSFGQVLSYIENHFVVQRLNDAFEGSWSFEVVSHEIIEGEVVVLGKLTAEGVTKTQFGSSKITRNKEKEIISLGDDCKAAGSNALRKAASLFGIGLSLYMDQPSTDQAQQAQPRNTEPTAKPSNINVARISTKQHKFLLSLSRDQKATKNELNAYCKNRYGVVADHLSREQASTLLEDLINDRINLLEKTDQAAA